MMFIIHGALRFDWIGGCIRSLYGVTEVRYSPVTVHNLNPVYVRIGLSSFNRYICFVEQLRP